ncbi:MAG: Ig-like domain-containing protein [Isosphaeraceae bacterium]|nr:Ig-like domain-containing protein [Isosphaeraceae bacterium]
MSRFDRMLSRAGKRRRNADSRRLRARIETLEDRRLPATLFVNALNTSGTADGTSAHPYPQIQTALDQASAGDTVDVAAGVYAESLQIDEPVILLGPNAGIDPNTGTRGPEAVIIPPADNTNTGVAILVESSGVTIDGLTLDGHNDAISSGTVLNGVTVNARAGVANVGSDGVPYKIDDLTVQNDIIRNFTRFGVLGDADDYDGTAYVSTGNAIQDNEIDNMPTVDTAPIGTMNQGRGISIEDSFYADVSGNVITRAATGIQSIYALNPPGVSGFASSITNNQVQAYDRGILVYTADDDAQAAVVSGNTVAPDPTAGPTATAIGIDVERVLGTSSVSLANNSVTGFPVGLQLDYSPGAGGITVNGGALSGNGVGVELTNAAPPVGTTTLQPVNATLNGVTIQGSATAGIDVVDALAQTGDTVTLTTGAGTTATGGSEGVSLSGPNAKLVTTISPTVTFSQTPPAQTSSSTATFAFAGSDSVSSAGDVTYRYQLDGGGWTATTSPLTLTGLAAGSHTLAVQVTDQGGLSGTSTASWQVQSSTITPPQPAAPVLAAGSDSGASSSDGITNSATPRFTGTVSPNVTVQVYANNALIGTVTAGHSGSWSFTVGGAGAAVASLAQGTYAITIATISSNGAVSPQSTALALTIDRTAPTVTLSTMVLPAYIFGIPTVPVVFFGAATDNSGVAPTLTYTVKNSSGRVVASGTAVVAADGTYRIMTNFDVPARRASTAQRTYTVTVTAVDLAGNKTSKASSFVLPAS